MFSLHCLFDYGLSSVVFLPLHINRFISIVCLQSPRVLKTSIKITYSSSRENQRNAQEVAVDTFTGLGNAVLDDILEVDINGFKMHAHLILPVGVISSIVDRARSRDFDYPCSRHS